MLLSYLLPLVFTAVQATTIIKARGDNNTTTTSTASGDGWVDCGADKWRTTLTVYVSTTGDDPGSTCEIRGYASLGSQTTNIKRDDLKIKTNFGYPGALVGTVVTDTVGTYEKSFHLKLYEEGNFFQADRVFWNTDYDSSSWNPDMWPCLDVGGQTVQGYTGNARYCIERTGSTCQCKGDQKLCGI